MDSLKEEEFKHRKRKRNLRVKEQRQKKRRLKHQSFEERLSVKSLLVINLNMEFTHHIAVVKIKEQLDRYKQELKGINTNIQPKLNTDQVIYVIYNIRNHMKYIGQTSKNAIQRFMEHLQAAKRLEVNKSPDKFQAKQKLLYQHMCSLGLDKWRVYAVEHLDTQEKGMFKQLADLRETFWIKYFNTLTPAGLNMILPINDVTYTDLKGGEIKRDINLEERHLSKNQLVPYKVRRYNSRNYLHRIQYIGHLIEQKQFHNGTLDRYSAKNQYWILTTLENSSSDDLQVDQETYWILRKR